ncbi:MAG: helix-turn-helix domain-containing protein [Rhodospirillales bacterium]
MKKPAIEDGPHPIDRYVGGRIRGRRMGIRLSQTKLGEAIGVTFQQIQKYESGANRVGASNLAKIAKALSVDVAFFFEDMPAQFLSTDEAEMAPGLADQPIGSLEANAMNSREAFELMHNYYRISDPTVRKRLFQLVKHLGSPGHPAE